MRIYVAASVTRYLEARGVAAAAEASGHSVTSTWFREEPTADQSLNRALRQRAARECATQVEEAEAIVALVSPAARGTLVEVGIARGAHRLVCLVGAWADVTLMLDLPGARWFATAGDALLYLAEIDARVTADVRRHQSPGAVCEQEFRYDAIEVIACDQAAEDEAA